MPDKLTSLAQPQLKQTSFTRDCATAPGLTGSLDTLGAARTNLRSWAALFGVHSVDTRVQGGWISILSLIVGADDVTSRKNYSMTLSAVFSWVALLSPHTHSTFLNAANVFYHFITAIPFFIFL